MDVTALPRIFKGQLDFAFCPCNGFKLKVLEIRISNSQFLNFEFQKSGANPETIAFRWALVAKNRLRRLKKLYTKAFFRGSPGPSWASSHMRNSHMSALFYFVIRAYEGTGFQKKVPTHVGTPKNN